MATTDKHKRYGNARSSFDIVLLAVVFFLIGFGLLMIYSTSSYEAAVEIGDAQYYLRKQMFSTVIGIVGLFGASIFSYHRYKRIDVIALAISIIGILLLKTPLGITRNQATRWLNLAGLSVQPAEIAKLGIIIFQASFITKLGKSIRTAKGIFIFMVPPTIVAALIYVISNNLSSAIIVMGIAVCMLFVAVPDYKPFIIIAAVVTIVAIAVVAYASGNDVSTFRLARIKAWRNPEDYSTDRAFQTLQALYAIGSGGIWGKGLGQSMQKRGFLPESQNDMIFSIICEELGIFGALVILVLFIVLIWSCMIIANAAKDQFGAMLVVGVLSHFAIQVILNIAVVTNTIPNTGITLPFISYGGSAVLFLLIEIGIVLNVSKSSRL